MTRASTSLELVLAPSCLLPTTGLSRELTFHETHTTHCFHSTDSHNESARTTQAQPHRGSSEKWRQGKKHVLPYCENPAIFPHHLNHKSPRPNTSHRQTQMAQFLEDRAQIGANRCEMSMLSDQTPRANASGRSVVASIPRNKLDSSSWHICDINTPTSIRLRRS